MRALSVQELDLVIGGYDYQTETEYDVTAANVEAANAAIESGQVTTASVSVTPIYNPGSNPGTYNPFNPNDPFGNSTIAYGGKIKVRC